MTSPREAIFTAIRRASGAVNSDPDKIMAEAQELIAEPQGIQPKFAEQSNLQRFLEKAQSDRVTATVSRIDSIQSVPNEIASYIEQNDIKGAVAVQPRTTLTDLDWSEVAIHHDVQPNEPVAVSIADFAVAESGSVVFLSDSDAPTLLNFLALHHIVVARESQIHRHLEDVFKVVGGGQENQPRNINIVTGTSGTADIEAKNIRGAHGPRYMHIIIVHDLNQ